MREEYIYIKMKEEDNKLFVDYIDTFKLGQYNSFESLFDALKNSKITMVYMADTALQFSYLIEWAKDLSVKRAKNNIYTMRIKDIVFKSVDHIYNAPFECICRDFELGEPSARSVKKLVDYIEKLGGKFSFRKGEFLTIGALSWLWESRGFCKPGEDILGARYNNWFNLEDYEFFKKRKIYRGGLCLINHELAGTTVEGLYKYDKNSFYPWAMTQPLPGGPYQYYKGRSYNEHDLVHVRISGTNKFKGLAPLSIHAFEVFDFFNEEMWLFNMELQELMNWYDMTVEYIGYCHWMWNKPDDMLTECMNFFYDKKSTTTGVEQRGYKLIMNNCYGKWAQEPNCTANTVVENGAFVEKTVGYNPYKVRSLAVAAKIASTARTELLRSIREATHGRPDKYFVYGDTDSMILTIPYDKVGKKLGEFKFEGMFQKGRALSKKCYMLYDGERYECHASGINRTALELEMNSLTWEEAEKRFDYGQTFMCPTRVKIEGGKKIVMMPRVLSKGLEASTFDNIYGVYEE